MITKEQFTTLIRSAYSTESYSNTLYKLGIDLTENQLILNFYEAFDTALALAFDTEGIDIVYGEFYDHYQMYNMKDDSMLPDIIDEVWEQLEDHRI